MNTAALDADDWIDGFRWVKPVSYSQWNCFQVRSIGETETGFAKLVKTLYRWFRYRNQKWWPAFR